MNFSLIEISDNDYFVLGNLMTQRFGIKLPPEKRIMFQARLQSRLRKLHLDSFEQYREYILSSENTINELNEMVNYISTNKTSFFRESLHFDLLLNTILPEILNEQEENEIPFLNCWSAGSSSGQEAFTLAMLFDNYRQEFLPSLDYRILGTDVSQDVLKLARTGVYPFAEAEQIPEDYLKKYVLKSKDKVHPKIKIINFLRAKVQFQFGNLMADDYQLKQQFQLIFIRNTLIYFNNADQTAILRKMLEFLIPGGYLFIGHSESLINRNLPIQIIAPSVYQKI